MSLKLNKYDGAGDMQDKPKFGKVYALTGGRKDKAISNGHSWSESEVKEHKKKMAKKMQRFDLVTSIMAHEDGSLDEKGEKELFAYLNKKGLTHDLQGHYGRENERRNRLGLNK
jgi:hypothetical protein